MVREHKLSTYISQIINPKGQIAVLPTHITKEFIDYYTSLYNLPNKSPPQNIIVEYITSSQLPSLSPEVRTELDSPP